MLLDTAVNHAIHKDEANQVYTEAIVAQPGRCVSRLIAAARLVEGVASSLHHAVLYGCETSVWS